MREPTIWMVSRQTCGQTTLAKTPMRTGTPLGERYVWKENDPSLAKLAEAVKEHKTKAEAAEKK